MRFKYSLSLSLLCLITSLSGCSTVPTQVIDGRNWSNHIEQVSLINHWSIRGKVGYQSAGQGGSANFMWTQNQGDYTISLSGPLAMGRAVITGNQQVAEMQHGNNSYLQTPDQLAIQLTGMPLPVQLLSWWVTGVPSPEHLSPDNLVLNSDGTASNFKQHGWQLVFSRYQFFDQGYLPTKIIGQKDEQSFKLIIKNWSSPEN